MDQLTIIGLSASILTAGSLIPQLVKLVKKKEGGDLSIAMLMVLFTGLGMWTWYGALKNDWIIMASNGFSMLVNAAISFFTIWYRR